MAEPHITRPRPGPLEREALGLLRRASFHLVDPREIREMRVAIRALESGERQASRSYLDDLRRVVDEHEQRHRERPGTALAYSLFVRGQSSRRTPPPALPRLESY